MNIRTGCPAGLPPRWCIYLPPSLSGAFHHGPPSAVREFRGRYLTALLIAHGPTFAIAYCSSSSGVRRHSGETQPTPSVQRLPDSSLPAIGFVSLLLTIQNVRHLPSPRPCSESSVPKMKAEIPALGIQSSYNTWRRALARNRGSARILPHLTPLFPPPCWA